MSVISKQYMASHTATQTSPGTIGRNELDTHADTCCAGANWKLMELTNEVCNVSPFLNTYAPAKEIPVGRCCTVCTCNDTGSKIIGCRPMLWFGSQMEHSLISLIQIREYGLPVFDNPFDANSYGIDGDDIFIPFDTMGTAVYFESVCQQSGKKNTCRFYF